MKQGPLADRVAITPYSASSTYQPCLGLFVAPMHIGQPCCATSRIGVRPAAPLLRSRRQPLNTDSGRVLSHALKSATILIILHFLIHSLFYDGLSPVNRPYHIGAHHAPFITFFHHSQPRLRGIGVDAKTRIFDRVHCQFTYPLLFMLLLLSLFSQPRYSGPFLVAIHISWHHFHKLYPAH